MSYPEGHVERFAAARNIIATASKTGVTDQTALKLGGKVGMTLEAYEAIAETLKGSEILITVPARHLTPGDSTAGFTISQSQNFPDGSREFKFVVPYQAHSMTVTVAEKDLDAVTFPLTKRGDAHAPSRRNLALGLPEDLHKPVYKQAEPVASYPAGTLIKDLKHFDRSQHVLFKCPEHEKSAWSSKDPYSSSIFPQSMQTVDCGPQCKVNIGDYVLTHEYLPTRNG